MSTTQGDYKYTKRAFVKRFYYAGRSIYYTFTPRVNASGDVVYEVITYDSAKDEQGDEYIKSAIILSKSEAVYEVENDFIPKLLEKGFTEIAYSQVPIITHRRILPRNTFDDAPKAYRRRKKTKRPSRRSKGRSKGRRRSRG